MSSYHFVGNGLLSVELENATSGIEQLLGLVAGLVADSGLQVVADQSARFENDGLTLVWILAESHLVLHVWQVEGYATVDLHVCDYRESNIERARQLVRSLETFCFSEGSANWNEIHLGDPVPES